MSLEGRTIAVVEDDPIMGESLVDRLSLEGAKVHWWQTCRAAETGLERRPARPRRLRHPPARWHGRGRLPHRVRHPGHAAFPVRDGLRRHRPSRPPDAQRRRRLRHEAVRHGGVPGPPHAAPAVEARHRRMRCSASRPRCRRSRGSCAALRRLTTPVLVTGETGSGKEVCARFLHGVGAGAAGPFMAVNCAAIPKDLMESELFGHERGAFTGATSRHRGYAERAGIGTLFLDEIGDLDLKLQAKLLRLSRTARSTGSAARRPCPSRHASSARRTPISKAGSRRGCSARTCSTGSTCFPCRFLPLRKPG